MGAPRAPRKRQLQSLYAALGALSACCLLGTGWLLGRSSCGEGHAGSFLDTERSRRLSERSGSARLHVGGSKRLASQPPADGSSLPLLHGSSIGGQPGAGSDACPVDYPRHNMDNIVAGRSKPYLLGGIATKPGCAACNRTDGWALPCQFKNGPLCPDWVQEGILRSWLERGFELALTLTPCDLWRHIRGRTLWLMGDSMMLDFYKSLTCFLFEFWPSLTDTPAVEGDEQLLAEFSKILPATCAPMLEGTRVCYIRVDEGQNMYQHTLPLLPRVARPTDLLVLNFGLHHNQDYKKRLAGFAAFYRAQRAALPRLLWQQTAQQHFWNAAGTGEYPGGKPPFDCVRIEGYTVVGDGELRLEEGQQERGSLLRGGWRNALADQVMRQIGIPVIQSFNESLPMFSAHRGKHAYRDEGHECTHFCHPSVPQAWVLALYRTLRGLDGEGGGQGQGQREGSSAVQRS